MRRILAAGLSIAMAGSTAAHEVCGPRKDIIEGLGKSYGETVGFQSITKSGEFLEVLVADSTGTFTIIATRPGGITCILESGQGNFVKRWDYGPQLDH